MSFSEKADYRGPFDNFGVPLLNYHGKIGLQYNPIAVAQYGLARYNRYRHNGDDADRKAFLAQADWLVLNLQENSKGIPVWNHNFDYEYFQPLKSPWYSGLAQGQGVSLLVRAYELSGDTRYREAAHQAFRSLRLTTREGGVVAVDDDGSTWIEEYVVTPSSHILNGFLWALWGVWDYSLATGDEMASRLWARGVDTLKKNLHRFDTGYWSLYDLSRPGPMRMLASPFYHRLHIVQLRVTARMTELGMFSDYADRWERYTRSRVNRYRARSYKALFKLRYY
jgi:hypothetical protein